MTKKNVMTVHEARKAGYTVRIQHVRQLNGVGAQTGSENLDCMLTRGEFLRAQENLALAYDDYEIHLGLDGDERGIMTKFGSVDMVPFSAVVSPRDGFTRVEVISPDGSKSAVGKCSFHNKPFNKRIGLMKAFGQAMKKVGE